MHEPGLGAGHHHHIARLQAIPDDGQAVLLYGLAQVR